VSTLTATVLIALVAISGTGEGWQNRPHIEDGHMFRESRPPSKYRRRANTV